VIKILLLGHRGVGKSSFLKRNSSNFPPGTVCVSLDQFIEQEHGCSIQGIFKEQGEAKFRSLEQAYLHELVSKYSAQSLVVDVGAGYTGSIPQDFLVIWLQRKIDLSQAQFLDRPLLDGQLQMSKSRFLLRQNTYNQRAHLQLELLEGNYPNKGEQALVQALTSRPLSLAGHWVQTILNNEMAQVALDGGYWPVQSVLEWRDDLVGPAFIERAVKMQSPQIFSLRHKKERPFWLDRVSDDHLWDWPLEWGGNSEAPILSLHQRSDRLVETLQSLPELESLIKLAVPIKNFVELKLGHEWQQEAPERRCFLPISSDGRWSWYRLRMAHKNPLSFFRTGQGSAPDQPSLLQVLNFEPTWSSFACVLGSPVSHSQTPLFHQDFFALQKINTLAVDVTESEWDGAVPFLQELGLSHAAVTSPLKKKAGEWIGTNRSINTLDFTGTVVSGTSTDEDGLRALLKEHLTDSIAVWGGGGVLDACRELIPEATYYSSRTGLRKSGPDLPAAGPQVVVWAVGPGPFNQQGVWPPKEWHPQRLIDLNYLPNSPGISWAHLQGVDYRSGLIMFQAQAQKQQAFWQKSFE
jgi:shikimate kinase